MIVKQTFNREDIETVLLDPVIYDAIADDNCDPKQEIPINDDYEYIGGYVNGEIVAIMVYHKYRDGNKCHVQVLPDYRDKYALQFGEQSLMFRGTQPLYAEIPALYSNVLAFAFRFGFEVIETIKQDYCKNGILHDLHILRFNEHGFYTRFNGQNGRK